MSFDEKKMLRTKKEKPEIYLMKNLNNKGLIPDC